MITTDIIVQKKDRAGILDMLTEARDAALVHEAMKIGDKGISWSDFKLKIQSKNV